MRQMRSHGLAMSALASALLLLLAGCEEDRPKRRPAEAPVLEAAGPDPVLEKWEVLGENPRFAPIRGLYERYAVAKIDDLANPMLPNLVLFTPRPIIDKSGDDEERKGCGVPGRPACEKVEDDVVERPTDPRAKRPLADYSVIVLMTGTSRPKAVVTDTVGGRFTLERGDPIGMEGGRVKAILQHKMLVGVPGRADPYVFSLEPPLSEFEAESGETKQEF